MTRWVSAAAFVVLCTRAAAGQTPADAGPQAITLEEAIDRGLAVSHRLAEVAARGDLAEAQVAQRHVSTLPQVAALAGYMRTNHVRPFVLPAPMPKHFRSRRAQNPAGSRSL